jgi:hypothetical protein
MAAGRAVRRAATCNMLTEDAAAAGGPATRLCVRRRPHAASRAWPARRNGDVGVRAVAGQEADAVLPEGISRPVRDDRPVPLGVIDGLIDDPTQMHMGESMPPHGMFQT